MASSSSSNKNLIMEKRDELMISPTTGVKTSRPAYFLGPTVIYPNKPPSVPTLANSMNFIFNGSIPPMISINGWGNPTTCWKQWVSNMASQHQDVWTRAGIHVAITNSTFNIHQDKELILRMAERWSENTNTFVFSWGEATVTLEDVFIIGGFSVLGDFVSNCSVIEGTEIILEQLHQARKDITKSTIRKTGQKAWMDKFRGRGSEIEHVAFMVYWLSRFVFILPVNSDVINKNVFHIAICLSRGIKIALAPAVLASLYSNLSSLAKSVHTDRHSTTMDQKGFSLFNISAPIKLVQVWAWERFPSLQPCPKYIGSHQPIMARWDGLKKTNIFDILSALNSFVSGFIWRPYLNLSNTLFHGLYRDSQEYQVIINDGDMMDESLEVLARCMRVSELSGLHAVNSNQYLPHRVAMQFGMDQDLPCDVEKISGNSRCAWANYTRPIQDRQIYVPGRHSCPCVTIRYWIWWKDNVSSRESREMEVGSSTARDVASSSNNSMQTNLATIFENMVDIHGKVVDLIRKN